MAFCGDDIETRTRDGWDVISIGLALVMLVVYAECLACDAFLRLLSGHFLYDMAILILSAWYTHALWSNANAVKAGKKAYLYTYTPLDAVQVTNSPQ